MVNVIHSFINSFIHSLLRHEAAHAYKMYDSLAIFVTFLYFKLVEL